MRTYFILEHLILCVGFKGNHSMHINFVVSSGIDVPPISGLVGLIYSQVLVNFPLFDPSRVTMIKLQQEQTKVMSS